MGEAKTYICHSCGYSAMVSGETDWGFVTTLKTFTCFSCKEIVDVIVGKYGYVYDKDQLDEQLIEGPIPQRKDFYLCPKCRGSDQLRVWNNRKRPCPKCEGKMEIDPDGILVLWD